MPPRKKTKLAGGASASAAPAAAASPAERPIDAAEPLAIAADAAAPAAAAPTLAAKKRASKRKAENQEESDAAAPGAPAAAVKHAAAASSRQRASRSRQPAAAASSDAAADASMEEGEEKDATEADDSASAAAAAGPGQRRSSRAARGPMDAARAEKAKATAEAKAVKAATIAAMERLLLPHAFALDSSRCPAPPHGLHKDVLHTLFAFTGMRDLAHLIQLSRGWYGGVRSVPWSSLHADQLEHFSVSQMCASPLVTHIGSLSIVSRAKVHKAKQLGITALDVRLLHANLPNLQKLETTLIIKASEADSWRFPALLQKLVLTTRCPSVYLHSPAIAALLAGVAELKHLTNLDATIASAKHAVDLAPLRPIAHQLKSFRLNDTHAGVRDASLTQLPVIREMTALTALCCSHLLNDAHSLFRSPLPFTQLQELTSGDRDTPITDAMAQTLLPLAPTLRALRIRPIACRHLTFLSSFVHLRVLALAFDYRFQPVATNGPDALIAALRPLTSISEFGIDQYRMTSADLAVLLACFPKLDRLAVLNCSVGDLLWLSSAAGITRLRLHLNCLTDRASAHPLTLLPHLTHFEAALPYNSVLRNEGLFHPRSPSPILPKLKVFTEANTWTMSLIENRDAE